MSVLNKMFQPSRILYEVVVGTFKSSGTPFEVWCRQNDITPNIARNALLGASISVNGQALLERLVDGAGRQVVTVAYRQRMERRVDDLNEAQGAAA